MEGGGMTLAYSQRLVRALKWKSRGAGRIVGMRRLYGDASPNISKADRDRSIWSS